MHWNVQGQVFTRYVTHKCRTLATFGEGIAFPINYSEQSKYEVSTLKIVQDSTNTKDLDKKSVGMPGTQPTCVAKFSVVSYCLQFEL